MRRPEERKPTELGDVPLLAQWARSGRTVDLALGNATPGGAQADRARQCAVVGTM